MNEMYKSRPLHPMPDQSNNTNHNLMVHGIKSLIINRLKHHKFSPNGI